MQTLKRKQHSFGFLHYHNRHTMRVAFLRSKIQNVRTDTNKSITSANFTLISHSAWWSPIIPVIPPVKDLIWNRSPGPRNARIEITARGDRRSKAKISADKNSCHVLYDYINIYKSIKFASVKHKRLRHLRRRQDFRSLIFVQLNIVPGNGYLSVSRHVIVGREHAVTLSRHLMVILSFVRLTRNCRLIWQQLKKFICKYNRDATLYDQKFCA